MSSSSNNEVQMDITNLLQQTNNINNIYCNIMDSFFMQRMGERIDYASLLDDLHECTTVISLLSDEKTKLRGMTLNDMTSNQILLLLEKYQDCLQKSIVQFIIVIEHLHKKREGIGKYSFFKYNTDRKTLKKFEQQRSNIGNVLQIKAVPYMASARRAR